MGDRGSHLSQRCHPRDVSQFDLRGAKCFFGALAFDELANLTAQSSHHVEQLLVRLSYLVAEKLDHPQHVCPEQNGKTEGCMQSLTGGDGHAQKISILDDIGNVGGLTAGPHSSRQPYPGHESPVAARSHKLRGLYGFFVPYLDAAEHP